jgi:hypothetical protein
MIDLDTITLAHGAHHSREAGMCAMEAVAFIAGEPHSDSPECASPVLANFLRNLNDAMDDEARQTLKPVLTLVPGTNTGPADEQTRGLMAVDWLVRTYLPTWLDLAGIDDIARGLRAHPEVTSWDALVAITPTLVVARERSGKAWDAARSAAWDAARSAARAAAWAAARDAAWAAARAAARSAARDAAWAAAGAALKPTVTTLQSSAVDLARRMALVGKP